MMHTAERSSRAACLVALLVSFISVDQSHSYTSLHHGRHTGVGNLGTFRASTSFEKNNYASVSTSLQMSSEGNPNGSTTEKIGNNDEKDLNYYEILGASQDASRGELKKKYIQLARVSHPDAQIGGGNSADKEVDFQAIAEAWRTLGNPKSRRRYDRTLKARAWGEAAQKLTNERLEQVAPVASMFMDKMAVPFLRKTSATVGKAMQGFAASEAPVTAKEEAADSATESSTENDAAAENIAATEETKVAIDKNVTAGTTETAPTEVEAPPEPVESIETITNQAETNGATLPTPVAKEPKTTDTIEKTAVTASIDEFDDDTPDYLVNKKSLEIEEQVKTQEEMAKTLSDEYNSVKEKRLFASLQSKEFTLTSCEAEEVLNKLNDTDTVSFVKRGTKPTYIKKEILSLRNTEEQFTEKLESYTKIDREWNSWLTKQESAKKTLRENKQKEFEARRALNTAEEAVSKANTDVLTVSNKLRGVEQEVRKSAQEMDRVSSTLSRKQERVQNALRRKTELIKGGISVEYVTAEEVKLLRQKELQLLGESKQIATMVAKLQSRADQLKKRAEALENLKKK